MNSDETTERAIEAWKKFNQTAVEVVQKRKEALDIFKQRIDRVLIISALDAAGYEYEEPTEELLRECFMDYVDCGYWHDIEIEDVEDITTRDMAIALIKTKKPDASGRTESPFFVY